MFTPIFSSFQAQFELERLFHQGRQGRERQGTLLGDSPGVHRRLQEGRLSQEEGAEKGNWKTLKVHLMLLIIEVRGNIPVVNFYGLEI